MTHAFHVTATLVVVLAIGVPTAAYAGDVPSVGDEALGASGGLRYRSDSTTFDAGSGYARAEVGCGGPRWHLIGGGADAGGPAGQGRLAAGRPIDSADSDARGDDGWLAGGYGISTAEITGYSVCVRDDAIRYRSKVVASDPTGLRAGSLGCGSARWQVVTGGSLIATSNSWTNSSYPIDGNDANRAPDDGWRARVYDTIGGAGGFTLHAACVRGVRVRSVVRGPISLFAGSAVNRRVDCGPGEHVVGGGARVTGPANRSRMVSTFPFDDTDENDVPDDGWQVRVYSLGGLQKKVTVFAICLR